MGDEFRPIEVHPNYRVSRQGEVQSRRGRGSRSGGEGSWVALKPLACRGYLTVNLSRGGAKRHRYVHRLVLEAFAGPPPPGMVCRHLDGDRANNRLENLAWGTCSENEQDKRRHGTWLVGERRNARLTGAEVLEIRRLAAEGARPVDLAATYGVTPGNIGAIIHGRSWRHLP